MRTRSLPGAVGAPLVLTCEHASAAVPSGYADLGLTRLQLGDHIGWDIGAADLTEELSRLLAAPAVLSAVSRLLVDCNRDLTDHDLMPVESHGVPIPGNAAIDAAERAARLETFYQPFHSAIDAALEAAPPGLLLSVHSFTPSLNGRERSFDVGVLFDEYDDLAELLAQRLGSRRFAVRMNEPYSGLAGLIFSARSHGRRHGRRYLEIEVNNRLLRRDADVRDVGARVAEAVHDMIGAPATLAGAESRG